MFTLNPVPLAENILDQYDNKKAATSYLRFFNSLFESFQSDKYVVSLDGISENTSTKCFVASTGNLVNISVNSLFGTSNSTVLKLTGIGKKYQPNNTKRIPINTIKDNGVSRQGFLDVTSTGEFIIGFNNPDPTTTFTNTGIKGFDSFSVTYNLF